jgi:MoxR-like ATPase
MTTEQTYRQYAIEEYIVHAEPFYLPVKDEIELFVAAYKEKIPVLLKGPTGCGKTRFIEYMAFKLSRPVTVIRDVAQTGDGDLQGRPLVTVACHEDLTASDLVGRYLLEGDSTRWIDGPITRAVKAGAICYLDEVVEARKDTTVLIHPLTDHRRILPIEKLGQIVEAQDGFLLVISYNPGYQSALKDLKHSTRQRFMAVDHRAREPSVGECRHGPREVGREGTPSQGARARGRSEHAAADLRWAPDPRGDSGATGLPGGCGVGLDGRSRCPAQHRRGGVVDL